MQSYINEELDRLIALRPTSAQIADHIKDIVSNSMSIRKGEMYMKHPDGSVSLCAKICSICGDNKTPLGKNILCYAPWFCDLCRVRCSPTKI